MSRETFTNIDRCLMTKTRSFIGLLTFCQASARPYERTGCVAIRQMGRVIPIILRTIYLPIK
jgi:hypothetical protein